MEEKSSRVVEVLLAAVRPVQLLTGKVLGIGLVAFGQATLIVAFSLGLAKAVGSDLLHGHGTARARRAPCCGSCSATRSTAGSTPRRARWPNARTRCRASRSRSASRSSSATSCPSRRSARRARRPSSECSRTCRPRRRSRCRRSWPSEQATWWQFTVSVIVSIACTIAVARLAATVYRRAILHTGRRVRLRELFAQHTG